MIEPEETIRAAIASGVTELCFTEHIAEAGFEEITLFQNREPRFVKITNVGTE